MSCNLAVPKLDRVLLLADTNLHVIVACQTFAYMPVHG
jgi:hypothetical protein